MFFNRSKNYKVWLNQSKLTGKECMEQSTSDILSSKFPERVGLSRSLGWRLWPQIRRRRCLALEMVRPSQSLCSPYFDRFVPHDVPGLIELFGSEDNFLNELTFFFEESKNHRTNVLPDPYFWAGNEVSEMVRLRLMRQARYLCTLHVLLGRKKRFDSRVRSPWNFN